MWEVLHLYSCYNQSINVESISNSEQNISAYATINATNDSMTVAMVNRSTITQTVVLDFKNFILATPSVSALNLSNLTETETFVSHTTNALKPLTTSVANNKLTVVLPPMSVSSVQLKGQQGATSVAGISDDAIQIFPNPTSEIFNIKTHLKALCAIYDVAGRLIATYPKGIQTMGKEWTKGSYVAVFSIDNQIVKMLKLVKE